MNLTLKPTADMGRSCGSREESKFERFSDDRLSVESRGKSMMSALVGSRFVKGGQDVERMEAADGSASFLRVERLLPSD